MSFPRYPKYKDSGVEWLGEVPEHWEIKPLYGCAHERYESNKGMMEDNLLSLSYGRIVSKDISSNEGLLPESFETYQIIRKGDIVFRLTDLQNDKRSLRSALVEEDGIITSAYLAVEPKGPNSRYMAFLFRAYDKTKVFYSMGGGLRQSMKFADVKRLPVVLPPAPEQTAIAAFLDRETVKIDALVTEQQRLMELLAEKRQAVISHAVTRGLNPAAPLKDSGIEWLGQVPDHWRVIPLKYLVTESVAGPYGASLTKAMYSDSGYRVYGQQQAITNDFTLGDYYITEEKYEEMRRYTVFPGDLLISVMGTIGKVAIVPDDVEPGIINPRLVRYRCGDKIAPQFMRTLLLTAQYQELLKLESNGSTMDGLNMRIIGDIPVVVPPLTEQLAILSHLHPEIIKFETLTAESQRAIDLLQERRTALISAAVTGQIKVS